MEIQRLMRRAAAAVAVSALILLAGPTQGAMAVPAGEGSSAAVAQAGPGGMVITVTGVVTEGDEMGCRILVPLTGSGGSGYLLLGGPPLKMGGTYRVTGEIRNVATICQQGTPLYVFSAVPV
jgi:hypothetical protein